MPTARYTRAQLVVEAHAAGFEDVDERLISYYVSLGLLDEGRPGRGRGRGGGVPRYWSGYQRDLLLQILRNKAGGGRRIATLCNLPVARWTYLGTLRSDSPDQARSRDVARSHLPRLLGQSSANACSGPANQIDGRRREVLSRTDSGHRQDRGDHPHPIPPRRDLRRPVQVRAHRTPSSADNQPTAARNSPRYRPPVHAPQPRATGEQRLCQPRSTPRPLPHRGRQTASPERWRAGENRASALRGVARQGREPSRALTQTRAQYRRRRPRRHALVVLGEQLHVCVDAGELVIRQGRDPAHEDRYSRAYCPFNRLTIVGTQGVITLAALRWLADVRVSFTHIDAIGRVTATSTPTPLDDARLRRTQALAPFMPVGLEVAAFSSERSSKRRPGH